MAALAKLRIAEIGGQNRGHSSLPANPEVAPQAPAKGIESPSFEEIRRRGVAVALKSGKMLSAPKQGSKSFADVSEEQVLTVVGEEGDWFKVSNGSATGFVPKDLVQRANPNEAFFKGVTNPAADQKGPLTAVSDNPGKCIDEPRSACVLGLIDNLLGESDLDNRHDRLTEIASVLFNRGYNDAGQRYLEQALARARQTEQNEFNNTNSRRVWPLISIANDLAQNGHRRRALEVYAEAILFARLSRGRQSWQSDADETAESLAYVAASLARRGFRSQATAVFNEAIQVAKAIPSGDATLLSQDSKRSERLSDIAMKLVEGGDVDAGLNVLSEAIEQASRMRHLNQRGFEDISRALRAKRLAEQVVGLGFFDLGIRFARNIGRPESRQEALAEIVELIASFDRNAANTLTEEAMRIDGGSAYAAANLIRAGYVEPGMWVFTNASNKPGNSEVMRKFNQNTIVEALASVQAFDRARDVANTITDEEYYKKSICSIAEEMLKAGRDPEVGNLLRSMRYASPANCAQEMASHRQTVFNKQTAAALKAREWDRLIELVKNSKGNNIELSSLSQITVERTDAAALARLYRAIPAGNPKARFYCLQAMMSAI
ncbi:MAG: hypothetical protein K2Y27_14445 [Xanthobacteraceae bacterium]|nr:hypothetical protein [Xanthobacteraceae bacterium]